MAAREILELMWAADKLSRTAGVNETSEVLVATQQMSVKGRALSHKWSLSVLHLWTDVTYVSCSFLLSHKIVILYKKH
jgi:hypothetical protein